MTSRSVSWLATLVIVSLVGASVAQASIIGTATLIKNPAGVPFASPDAALPSPWVSYQLKLTATAGETIQAIQANITGGLHQRWNVDPNDDTVFLPSAQSTNATNGDSHISAPSGSLFGSGPNEDNPGTGSPLASTATAQYGVGTFLQGAWALTAPGSTANVAYIVVKAGSQVNTNISVLVADPNGATIGSLAAKDFTGFLPVPEPSTIALAGLALVGMVGMIRRRS